MSSTLTVAEAQSRLREIIENLAPGEEVVLVDNERPVARIVAAKALRPARPQPGLGKGSILNISPDFDAPLEEFREYLE